MKILVLTPYLPHRRVGHGGGTAVRDLVTSLARTHEVRVAALVRPGEEDLCEEVTELGVSVAPIAFRDHQSRGRARAAFLFDRAGAWFRSRFSGYPWYVEKYRSDDISRQVLAIAEEFSPDAIQIEYLQLALLVRDLRRWRDKMPEAACRLILNSHELGSLPRERRAARTTNPVAAAGARREAAAWRRLQVDATGWADHTLCVTPEDHVLFRDMGGQNLLTVPLGMDLERIRADWSPGPVPRFLFVGSFAHRPNRLAADFLIHTMWPAVSAALPDGRLVIAGRGSREFLDDDGGTEQWAARGVDALGFVDDLTDLFRDCRLFVAPLPEGGGIKIKILEAMARGIPVVTTAIGAEGITDSGDGAAVITPCDASFAEAVIALAGDPDRATAQAQQARHLMEKGFSWTAITRRLTAIYSGK